MHSSNGRRRGATALTYALGVGLIALGALTAVNRVGESTTELFTGVASTLDGTRATPAPDFEATRASDDTVGPIQLGAILSVPLEDLLSNDDGEGLRITGVGGAVGTSVSLGGSAIQVTPSAASGVQFSYTVQGADGRSDTATVSVSVTTATSCKALLDSGQTGSGTYTVDFGFGPLEVYCDQSRDGGGWMLLATSATGMSSSEKLAVGGDGSATVTATDGTTVAAGGWDMYTQNGYGTPSPSTGFYWMPLGAWSAFTSTYSQNDFFIDNQGGNGDPDLSHTDFSISGSTYAISWGGCGSSWILRNSYSSCTSNDIRGQAFTTWDRDNDTWSSNCARNNVSYNGGWWYTNCWQNSMFHRNNNFVGSWYRNANASASQVSRMVIWIRER